MKLKVLRQFSDKHTHECYEIGRILEVKESRGKEIIDTDETLVEVLSAPKKQTTKEN